MMKNNEKIGVYIHIPFCVKKCSYCDFISFSAAEADKERYIDRLCNEIRLFCENRSIRADSVFIGGGTPSVLGVSLTEKLMSVVRGSIELSDDCEITTEINPGTMDREKAEIYKELGINRISMGVQSLDDALLKRLGRIHRSCEFYETFEILREAGFDNINTDLMFALPGQEQKTWEKTLEAVIKLKPEHISFYSLIIEEGTPFYEDFKAGKLNVTDDETDRKMYSFALKKLAETGYHHYEISNAAVPGKESRHNLKYWNMQNYIGFGLGAHSFIDGARFCNTDDFGEYNRIYAKYGCNASKSLQIAQYCGFCVPGEYKLINYNNQKDNMEELIFTGLRKIEGISEKYFREFTGCDLIEAYSAPIDKMKKEGLLIREAGRIKLTRKGLDFANYVIREFIV